MRHSGFVNMYKGTSLVIKHPIPRTTMSPEHRPTAGSKGGGGFL